MSDHQERSGVDFDNVEIVENSPAAAARGRDVQDFISMKNAIPSRDWIYANVVAKGPGTRVEVARIIGKAVKTELKTNTYEGKELNSIKLVGGQFEMTIYATGEVVAGVDCYLPKAFSRQVESALAGASGDPSAALFMDISLGLEATAANKAIAYRWTVKTFMGLPADKELDELRSRRIVPELENARQERLTLEHAG